ncbi:signal peptidase I [Acetanaerobacterium elongatum]|uniref:Signal peptidase I n=1 Tax=Acetanaerobacterium elongatum TaxID=258515 RepID=A0A1G9V2X4_9FIRM|nr:signal peptidase I [Acetanaerobacterium elongatum]SDM66205.1 signal peptidase, endoplasmic reticulum-type [Acetanaerobacterium elongatum]
MRRICNLLAGVLIVIAFLPLGVLTLPQLAGYTPLSVLSGSMEPACPVGSVVFIRPTAPDAVKVNDIITFALENNARVTHRVTQILYNEQAFVTKGDANNTNDLSPVPFNRLVGKVQFSLPLLGYLAVFIKTGFGFAALSILFVLIILLWLIPGFQKGGTPSEPAAGKAADEPIV